LESGEGVAVFAQLAAGCIRKGTWETGVGGRGKIFGEMKISRKARQQISFCCKGPFPFNSGPGRCKSLEKTQKKKKKN